MDQHLAGQVDFDNIDREDPKFLERADLSFLNRADLGDMDIVMADFLKHGADFQPTSIPVTPSNAQSQPAAFANVDPFDLNGAAFHSPLLQPHQRNSSDQTALFDWTL